MAMAMAMASLHRFSLVLVLLPLLSSSFFAIASAEDVLALTDDTFEEEIGKEKDALVEFYAPWYNSSSSPSSHSV
mgnify:CR=1 FL=1